VLIALIGAFLLWRSLKNDHHVHGKDGKTLALVTGVIPCPLTTFIMSYALARGMLAAGLAVTAAMTLGMIATVGGIALAAAFARDLSFPKIISGRIGGAVQPGSEWRR
jgi:nickel/cobalt transporter (NicO) family protein